MLCLKVPTDAAWAEAAMRDLDAVLVDHAHCEMKAASNALSLAARHPGDAELARALTDLAREEIDHFQRVLAMLVERQVTLGPPPVDAYAAELRKAAGELPRERANGSTLVDRLLVGALIEARSCERFKLLADATAKGPVANRAAADAFPANVLPIVLPSLRERQGDIPLLAMWFLERFCKKTEAHIKGFTPEAMCQMESYHWPGNVRELRNIVERLAILCDGDRIDFRHLPPEIRQAQVRTAITQLPPTWDEFKRLKH